MSLLNMEFPDIHTLTNDLGLEFLHHPSLSSGHTEGGNSILAGLRDGTTKLDNLLLQADSALYQAKQEGKDRYVVYGQGVG